MSATSSREARSGAGAGKQGFGRVLLKLSGESLMGDREYGVDPRTVSSIGNSPAGLRGCAAVVKAVEVTASRMVVSKCPTVTEGCGAMILSGSSGW